MGQEAAQTSERLTHSPNSFRTKDIPHLQSAAMDPTLEDNDQYPDFRLLLAGHSKGSQQALPTKEGKASQEAAAFAGDDAAAVATLLDEQYDAYFQILKEERRAAERTYSRAVYEPEHGLFRVTVNRGTQFVSMGHSVQGQMYLYPEEALYLMDRGSLLIEHQGVEISLQQMWSMYLSPPVISFHERALDKNSENKRPDEQEYHSRTEHPVGDCDDATTAMERYLTYAYLKRLGFVVTRPGTYDTAADKPEGTTKKKTNTLPQLVGNQAAAASTKGTSTGPTTPTTSTTDSLKRNQDGTHKQELEVQLQITRARHPYRLWSLINSTLDYYATAVRKWWQLKLFLWTGAANRPLIMNSDQISIEQILPKLQIIPDFRLASTDKSSSLMAMARKIDFLVYKPAGAFKKRQPGIPDYRVVVLSGDSMLPSIPVLHGLLQGQEDPVEAQSNDSLTNKGTSTSGAQLSSASKPKTKKNDLERWPRILFAVVSGGQVSFINMYNAKATP